MIGLIVGRDLQLSPGGATGSRGRPPLVFRDGAEGIRAKLRSGKSEILRVRGGTSLSTFHAALRLRSSVTPQDALQVVHLYERLFLAALLLPIPGWKGTGAAALLRIIWVGAATMGA